MSISGGTVSGWGYDKDIAASMERIAESVEQVVKLLEEKQEENVPESMKIARAAREKYIALLKVSAGHIEEILNDHKIGVIEKHKALRSYISMLKIRAINEEREGA